MKAAPAAWLEIGTGTYTVLAQVAAERLGAQAAPGDSAFDFTEPD